MTNVSPEDFTLEAGHGGSSGLGAGLAGASTKGIAELLTKLMEVRMAQEQAKRKAEAKTLAEVTAGRSEALSQGTQGQINPLKELIANFKAAIK